MKKITTLVLLFFSLTVQAQIPMQIDLEIITNIDNPTISDKVSVFPNPVKNIFHVNLGEDKIANLEISDIQGRLLMSEVITSGKGIDVSSLPSGLYFIVVDKEAVYKIIKE
ncbi:MAG: T9SS type A sorting domain-containing protein [Lentimicrobiaceae bacterium]|nr:T9SS type A sorting domain-containing protein [Lentimicrobiaceae bacterium]